MSCVFFFSPDANLSAPGYGLPIAAAHPSPLWLTPSHHSESTISAVRLSFPPSSTTSHLLPLVTIYPPAEPRFRPPHPPTSASTLIFPQAKDGLFLATHLGLFFSSSGCFKIRDSDLNTPPPHSNLPCQSHSPFTPLLFRSLKQTRTQADAHAPQHRTYLKFISKAIQVDSGCATTCTHTHRRARILRRTHKRETHTQTGSFVRWNNKLAGVMTSDLGAIPKGSRW